MIGALKDRVVDIADFVQALERVAGGGSAIDAEVVGQILGRSRRTSELDRLTPREREVLQLVAEGHTTKQIAAALHVSVKTVETHRKHLMDKLNLPSVAHLTRYAILEGITPLNL